MENEGFNGRCVALLASLRARALIIHLCLIFHLTYIFVCTLFSSSAYLANGWRSRFLSSISLSPYKVPGHDLAFFSLQYLLLSCALMEPELVCVGRFERLPDVGFLCAVLFRFSCTLSLSFMRVLFTVLGRLELQMGGYNDVYEMQ